VDALSDFADVYVTTSPMELPTVRTSTIAKHDAVSGEVIGGAHVNFYALDSIVTSDNQLISVGFEWTPGGLKAGEYDLPKINMSKILPYLERKAVFQVFESKIDPNVSSCIGCDVDWHGAACENECTCKNGYCNDDLDGDGSCFCTIMSYGETCEACDGLRGSCDPLIGLCNSGPTGDGTCKFCYSLEIDLADNLTNSSFDFGIGDHYGPQCKDECKCNTDNGICYTTGNASDARAGHCIFCKDSNFFGLDCDEECACDETTEYCSYGVSGTGCIAYDYGGLLKDKGWEFYTVIASALFVLFFSVTWWQTHKHFKAHQDGKSIPWCPQRKKKGDEEADAMKDEYKANDLKEHMIKQQNIQNNIVDPNEPPAVSRPYYHQNGNGVEANDDKLKYNI